MQDERSAFTTRALMVLDREARRAAECAERVRLVTQALAKRYGVATRTGRTVTNPTLDAAQTRYGDFE